MMYLKNFIITSVIEAKKLKFKVDHGIIFNI